MSKNGEMSIDGFLLRMILSVSGVLLFFLWYTCLRLIFSGVSLGLFSASSVFSGASVDDVVPVSAASGRKLHVPLDEEDAGVADLAAAFLVEAEAFLEERLVPFAVGETGAEKDGINILMKYCIYISIGKLMSHV